MKAEPAPPTASLDGATAAPNWRNRVQAVLLALLLALPAFIAANYVFQFGRNVPVWDQWVFVPLLESASNGTLRFAELYAQHNEHRIFFPRLVMLGLAKLSRWDTRAEMWFGWSALVGMAIILMVELFRRLGRTPATLWKFVPVAWLVLTLRQSENLLWGFQLQVFLAALTLVLALSLLELSTPLAFAGALLSATICSFSFAAGLAVWPAGALLLWLSPSWPGQKKTLLAWGVAGLVVLAAYLDGYQGAASHPPPGYFLHHLGKGAYFFIASFGGSLVPGGHPRVAAVIGALLLVLCAAAALAGHRHRADRADLTFGLALVAFSAGTGAMTTIGRLGFEEGIDGVGYAVMSRYTTLTLLGVYGAYRCALSFHASRMRAVLGGGVAALMLLGTLSVIGGEYQNGRRLRQHRRDLEWAVRRVHELPDEKLKGLFVDVALVRRDVEFLERSRLSVFKDPGSH